MTSAYPPGPIEALDAFAEVLADAEAGSTRDAFYGRLCYAICDLASMDRAVIVRYDEALRRVRVAGTHNLDLSEYGEMELSVDVAPITREALERDAVIEVPQPSPEEQREQHLLWTLGKTAALAAAARIATFEGERARELQHRIDMAREVHDGVVQRLFGVSLALDSDGDFPADARKRAAAEIQLALSEL